MNFAIIGYGKMGKEIEQVALQRGHHIGVIVDPSNNSSIDKDQLGEVDVAFEFSSPDAVVANLTLCAEIAVPVVCGTTGWLKDWDIVVKKVEMNSGALFYASNFSLGVNLFFKLNQSLSRLLNKFPEYRPHIEEIHHSEKFDTPSGTAISIADTIMHENSHFNSWILNRVGSQNELPIFAIREGKVSGTHSVNYVSDNDKILIRHEAFSRSGFAKGAVTAAEFLCGKKGIYNMNDLIQFSD